MSTEKTKKVPYLPRPSGTTSLIFEHNAYRTEAVDPLSGDSSVDGFIDDEDEESRDDVKSDDDQDTDDDSDDEHSFGRQNRSKRLRIPSDDESESSKSSQEMIGRRSSKKKKAKRVISSDSDSEPEDSVGNRSGGRVVLLDDKESDQPGTSAADQPKKPRHSARVNVMKQRHQRSPIKSALEDLEALRKAKEQRVHPVLTPPKAAADNTNHVQEGDNCDENMSTVSEIVVSDSNDYRSPRQDEAEEDHSSPPAAPIAEFLSSPVAAAATVVHRNAPLTEEDVFESHQGEVLPDFRLVLGPLPSKLPSPISPRRRPPSTIPSDDTYLEELVDERGLVEECFLVSGKVCEVSYLRRVFLFLVDNDRRITVRFSPMDQLSLLLPGFPHLEGEFVELSGTLSVNNELDVLNVRYLADNQPESRRWEILRDKGVGMWPQGVAPKMVAGVAEALDQSDGTAVCFDAFVTNDPVVQNGARSFVHLSDYVCDGPSPAIRVEFNKLPRYIENFCPGAHLFVHVVGEAVAVQAKI